MTRARLSGRPMPAHDGVRRWGRRLLLAVASVLLLWLLAWLAVPPLLKWQGQKVASAELGRAVSIGAVDFRPWSLELTASDLRVAGMPGAPEQLKVARVYLDAAFQSLFRLAPVLDAVQVDAPELRLAHLGDGRYDVDDILARLTAGPAPKEPGKPLRFALYNIEVKGGRVDFDDRAVGQLHQVRDIELALPFVSSLPSARKVKVQPRLAMAVNGSAFDSQAQALPFDDTRRTEATLQLAALDLKPYLGYLPASLPLRLQAAVLDADLKLAFQETPKASLLLTGTLALSGLHAADRQGQGALAFDALKLQLAEVRPLERSAHVAQVQLEGLRVGLRRDRAGRLNVLPEPAREPGKDAGGSAGRMAPASAAAGGAGAGAAPLVAIDRLVVQGGEINWDDASTVSEHAKAAVLRLGELQLEATSIKFPLEQPLAFKGSATLQGDGGAEPATPAAVSAARPAPPGRARAPARAKAAAPVGPAQLAFAGQASGKQGEARVQLTHAALALAEPYLAAHLVPRVKGVLDADLQTQWAIPDKADAAPEWSVSGKRVVLSKLALADARAPAGKGGAGAPVQQAWPGVERIELADVRADSRTRAVALGRLGIERPRVLVERDRAGRWMFESWLRAPPGEAAGAAQAGQQAPARPARPAAQAAAADSPWRVDLREVSLAGGTVGWHDEQPQPAVRAELSNVALKARGIALPPGNKPIGVDLSAALGGGQHADGEAGRLAWRGQAALAPLSAEGTVNAERLPIQLFEPYFGDALNIRVLRADTGFKGKVSFAETAQGLRLRVTGDARVQELRTHSRPGTAVAGQQPALPPASVAGSASQAPLAPVAMGSATGLGEELLSWKQLALTGLDVQLEPARAPQVSVGSTLLSDFYARLIILPSGRFNLQDVLRSSASPASAPATGPAASASAPAIPASAGAAKAAAPGPLAPVIRLGPTRLVKGRIDFSDRFIKPNYSADLSELDGTLGAFSSVAPASAPQMAELVLSGRAEGSAALEVRGKANPLAEPLALDIQAKMADLDLPPLSPYSVKYAGHGIERGKLSMDVAYRIQPDGMLTASNKLVLNQLEFGAPVAGAPASLPVQLATALLSDSQGVIDLDLPISGSINDPQFSLGPIIFKAIINLIGKAITAPFTLLARALGGGGDDLAMVAFDPGSARLAARAREQLDRVAKAMNGRPQLKLTVVGAARLAAEREGLRRERLQALVAAEGRGEAPAAPAPASAASAAQPAGTAAAGGAGAAPALSGERYAELLKRLYRRADIPGRPRNAIGMLRDVPVPEMEKLLMAHIEVGEDAMRQLALQRGVAVKEYLAGKGVAPARLFLGATQTGTGATAPAGARPVAAASAASASAGAAPRPWSPHAELTLGVK